MYILGNVLEYLLCIFLVQTYVNILELLHHEVDFIFHLMAVLSYFKEVYSVLGLL